MTQLQHQINDISMQCRMAGQQVAEVQSYVAEQMTVLQAMMEATRAEQQQLQASMENLMRQQTALQQPQRSAHSLLVCC